LTLLCGVALAFPERDCSGFNSAGEAGGEILAAIFATAFWFAVIATVVYAVRRISGRRRSWRDAQLSTVTLVIGAAFVFFAITGLALQRDNDCGGTGALVPPPHAESTTGETMNAGQRAVVVYINQFVRCTERVAPARNREKRFLSALRKGQWTRATVLARTQQRLMISYSGCLSNAVPDDDPRLADPARRTAASVALMARAWSTYKRGAEQASVKLMDRGDHLITVAQKRARRAALTLDGVYRDRGGKTLANHINLDRLLKVREQAGLG
jgi:hypothetical protein